MDQRPKDDQAHVPYGAKLRRELEDDYRVFFVTAWGYAADHYFGWFPKALNVHPEIFALLAHEGSRPKYLKERTRSQRPPLVPFTEFLNDMGMTYQAIGDCYSYRAGQMPELLSNSQYEDIPVANLVRHPAPWLEFYVRWRAGNMRMRAGGTDPLAWEWKVAHHGYFHHLGLRSYEREEVEVWAAFQGMVQLNAVLGDVSAIDRHIPVERVATDRKAFTELTGYLTKGRCVYEPLELDRVFAMTHTLFRGEEPVETDPRVLVESWPDWKVDAFRQLVTPEALAAYKSFGYEMHGLAKPPSKRKTPSAGQGPARPLFVSSVMKSGTWLLREVLERLTGLTAREPKIVPGRQDYGNEMLIDIAPGTFFSWHSIINDRTTALLKGAATKNIFLVRNIYDVIISMYNHLAKDADDAIGRSIRGAKYFQGIPPETAIGMIIAGFTTPELTWDGIAPHVRQVASFLEFMESGGDALLLTYRELTHNKMDALRRIARYLEMPVSENRLKEIADATEFDAMKATSVTTGTQGHFTDKREREARQLIEPYYVSMVDHVVMEEIPDAAVRLGRHGVPWLFDIKGALTALPKPGKWGKSGREPRHHLRAVFKKILELRERRLRLQAGSGSSR